MNNFWKRAISGFLFVVILTGCIFLHPIAFYVLFFTVNIIGLREFSRMAKHLHFRLYEPLLYLCGSLLFTAGFVHIYYGHTWVYPICYISSITLSICELYRNTHHGLQNIAFAHYAIFYLSLPFTLLMYLPYILSGKWEPIIIFLPFLLVWVNDTFAYLCGRTFGRHKLFPRISPKKTWEGAIGGGLATIGASFAILPFIKLSLIDNIAITCIVVIFGIYGDLIESLFKRTIEIKDSGAIMPGHGGILDRFDAVLYVIPAIFIYLEFIGQRI